MVQAEDCDVMRYSLSAYVRAGSDMIRFLKSLISQCICLEALEISSELIELELSTYAEKLK